MEFYHGTSVKGLTELKPNLSEHGKPYIYFSTNIVVAAFYTVHCVERPHNFFPFGFDKNGVPYYTEYYKNALADTYEDKKGYIYKCNDVKNIENPTHINCAYVCEQPVLINSVIEINNMYEWFLQREQMGEISIVRFDNLTQKQIENSERMIGEEISNCNLREFPELNYAKFIKSKFPKVWNCTQ